MYNIPGLQELLLSEQDAASKVTGSIRVKSPQSLMNKKKPTHTVTSNFTNDYEYEPYEEIIKRLELEYAKKLGLTKTVKVLLNREAVTAYLNRPKKRKYTKRKNIVAPSKHKPKTTNKSKTPQQR